MSTDHLAHMLLRSAERVPERPALVLPERPGRPQRAWTYAELAASARALAERLVGHGVAAGDRIAIFSGNQPAWTVVDFACHLAGAVPVPVYPTSTPPQAAHVLGDSGTVAVFVDGPTTLDRVLQVWDDLPALREVVVLDPLDDAQADAVEQARAALEEHRRAHVHTVAELVAAPLADPAAAAAEVDARLAAASGEDVATIVYTSGTTGRPKGVVLQHRAFLHELRGLEELFDVGAHDTSLCFLPLSHALERGWSYFVYYIGAANVFVTNPKEVADHLRSVRPTLVVSVPKLYETVYAGAHALAAASPAKQRVFDWALRVGGEHARLVDAGAPVPRTLAVRHALARRLVLHNVEDVLGGPKSALACGGAPLRREVEDFFHAAGVPIQVGYGLTEAAPLVTFNSPGRSRPGTVGTVLQGGELDIAEDGEIRYRAPNVMRGYWNDPEATAEVLTPDGWLRTGDAGSLDADGYLTITDRLKDIVVTLQGKNIAPGPIEALIARDPLVENAVVLGDDRPCLVALVEPAPAALADWVRDNGLDDLAGLDDATLRRDPRVVAELQRRVEAACASLPGHEVVRAARVLPHELTMENGLLTPTLKVRRRRVEQEFQGLVDEMYAEIAERRRAG